MENTKAPTLIDLHYKLESLLEQSDGELTDDVANQVDLFNQTELTHQEIEQKIENYYGLMNRLKPMADYYKAESDKYLKMKRGLEAVVERMNGNLREYMRLNELNEIHGVSHRFVLSKTSPKLIIEDESKIGAAYKVITTEIDTKLLKAVMQSGTEVEGAKLEDSYSLRSYLKRK